MQIAIPSSTIEETRRCSSLEELRRLRLAVESSGEIIFMTDASGTITYVNPEFERVYGYTSADIVGRASPRILKGGATPTAEYEAFWRQLRNGEVVKREFVNRRKDGGTVHIESCVNPIAVNDELVGFLAVQRDITARKKLEREFTQAQKMEAVGRLAGGVAHDFNNLLTAILGYADLLLTSVGDDSNLAADLHEIKNAGERARRLTKQLLTFSRAEPFSPKVINLNDIVGELQKMLSRVIGEDIVLDVDRNRELAYTKGDRSHIEQIILNLVVNARDAMPRGGTIRLRTTNVHMTQDFCCQHEGAIPGDFVALTVEDNGAGIPDDVLPHVFEPFFTTKPAGIGTGLGLSTVYGIVKQSGGYITVDSVLRRGTTFTIYFPVARPTMEHTGATRKPSHPISGTETILLVEDEPQLRRLLQRAVQQYGYAVLGCETVEDALAIAECHPQPIDLLLSDVVMPGLTGPELAQRVVALRPSIKVLYMSGYPNQTLENYLPKPFTPQLLAARIRESLDTGASRAQA
jgi:two-component system, cell cycle sensor histidine kinase and response regulator CckA